MTHEDTPAIAEMLKAKALLPCCLTVKRISQKKFTLVNKEGVEHGYYPDYKTALSVLSLSKDTYVL